MPIVIEFVVKQHVIAALSIGDNNILDQIEIWLKGRNKSPSKPFQKLQRSSWVLFNMGKTFLPKHVEILSLIALCCNISQQAAPPE